MTDETDADDSEPTVVDPDVENPEDAVEVDVTHDRNQSWLQAGRDGRFDDVDVNVVGDEDADEQLEELVSVLDALRRAQDTDVDVGLDV